jgi:exodeoxyribonuclease VII large subunit
LISPKKIAEDFQLKIDDLCNQMAKIFLAHVKHKSYQLAFQKKYLVSSRFHDLAKRNKEILDQKYINMLKSIDFYTAKNRYNLIEITGKINALNPIAILERGYSITRKITNKKIIKDSETVSIGENLEIILAKGILNCNVEGKSSHVKKDI